MREGWYGLDFAGFGEGTLCPAEFRPELKMILSDTNMPGIGVAKLRGRQGELLLMQPLF
jgi:hypothetical protein